MLYIMIFLHLLIAIEGYILIKKRNRKKGTILEIINGIFFLLNIFIISKTLSSEISTIVYFQNKASLLYTFYFILNLCFVIFSGKMYQIMNQKRIQPKILKYIIPIILMIYTFFLLIILFPNLIYFGLFASLIYSLIKLVKSYLKTSKKYTIIVAMIIGTFLFFSYCTYTGAARLKIALMGYPITAYKTGLEELKYYREKNVRKYISVTEVTKNNGKLGVIEVKNYVIFKVASEQTIG